MANSLDAAFSKMSVGVSATTCGDDFSPVVPKAAFPPSQTARNPVPCAFHFGLGGKLQGSCTAGEKCRFSHDEASVANYKPNATKSSNASANASASASASARTHAPVDTSVPASAVNARQKAPDRKMHICPAHGPVYAAGILMRDLSRGTVYVLREMNEGKLVFADPGGKAEHSDKTPFETASREFEEEIGFPPPDFGGADAVTEVYVPKAKYLAFVMDFKSTSASTNAFAKTGSSANVSASANSHASTAHEDGYDFVKLFAYGKGAWVELSDLMLPAARSEVHPRFALLLDEITKLGA